MKPDEIIEMARHIADTFGTRMCDENNDTHGEELYAMGMDDIVETIKLVAAKERERIIEANAPELEKANAHIKRLEEHAYDLVGKLRVANIKLSMQPQRTWVGLTNEEHSKCWHSNPDKAIKNVEAKLKEKNT